MTDVNTATDTSTLEIDDGGNGENSKRSAARLLSRSLSKISNATYDTKKNMAQRMMDIALLTANANQLRYILEFRGKNSTNFVLLLVLIACSLILQVFVGTVLIFKGRMTCISSSTSIDKSSSNEVTKMDNIKLNNYVVLGVFLITVINIFIAAFTGAPN
ncbi:ninjurin-1-like [Melanaphis sacchari]|uniref:Ninjurin-1 n=1 Tax=Melanaphis sacchari TaxID=742174 RepID=A0A2H8TXL4_9HEMI|nr:ninjurin-1-like [Melanaphis sacchari]